MAEARDVVRTLPSEAVGKCVLGAGGELFVGSAEALRQGLSKHELSFHAGHIGGALPQIVGSQHE